eukprot:3234947-Pleurochrysis_carterae.AAC.1
MKSVVRMFETSNRRVRRLQSEVSRKPDNCNATKHTPFANSSSQCTMCWTSKSSTNVTLCMPLAQDTMQCTIRCAICETMGEKGKRNNEADTALGTVDMRCAICKKEHMKATTGTKRILALLLVH